MDSATSATGAGSKLLKLQARKQKIQLTSPSAPISPLPAPKSNILPLRGLQYSVNDSVDGGYPFMMGGIESISTNDYLVRIKEENEILMHLLNEIQTNKAELSKRLRDLEVARDAILSLRPSVTKEMIDTYLTEGCPLAEKNRIHARLTPSMLDKAKEIHDGMLNIAARFRSNQIELQDFLMQQFVNICDHALNDNAAMAVHDLLRLEQITAADPANLTVAMELASNLEKTVFVGAADRFTRVLKEEVTKRHATMQLSLQSSSEHKDAYREKEPGSLDAAQATALQQQNDQLRATVAELRQRLAKLKVSNVAGTSAYSKKGLPPSASATSPRRSSVKGGNNTSSNSMNPRSPENNNNNTSMLLASIDELDGDDNDDNEAEEDEDDVLQLLNSSHANITLPPLLKSFIQEQLQLYVEQIVDSHPLAAALNHTGIRFVLEKTTEEVMNNGANQLFASILRAMQRSEILPLLTVPEDEVEQAEYESLFQAHQPELVDAVSQLVKLNSVHGDVVSLVTMMLVYMRQRMDVKSMPAEPMTSLRSSGGSMQNVLAASGSSKSGGGQQRNQSPPHQQQGLQQQLQPQVSRGGNNSNYNRQQSPKGMYQQLSSQAQAQGQSRANNNADSNGMSSLAQYMNSISQTNSSAPVSNNSNGRHANNKNNSNSKSSSMMPATTAREIVTTRRTGGGGNSYTTTTSPEEQSNSPYLYRSRSDSGDDFGAFPSKNNLSPKENVPRYMLPKNKTAGMGGQQQQQQAAGGGDRVMNRR